MRSLKARLILSVAGVAVVLTAAAGVTLYLLARNYLLDEFDAAVVGKTRLIASAVEFEYGEIDLDFQDLDIGEYDTDGDGFFQLWLGDETLYRSPSLGDADLSTGGLYKMNLTPRWVDLPDGRRGRVVVYEYDPEDDGDELLVTLAVAHDAEPTLGALGALRMGMIGIGVALAVLLSAVTAWVVGRELRPVDDLASRLGEIDERRLGQRITLPDMPDELRPIVTQFDALSVRLATAFERERSFSADVAHELRTPLAGLRTSVEVALSRPRSSQELTVTLRKILQVVEQTQRMIESLLQLAALENGRDALRVDDVDLKSQIDKAWAESAADNGAAAPFELHQTWPDDAVVRADPALLNVVLQNVFRNARAYTDPGGEITLHASVDNGDVTLRVANTGSRVAAHDAAHVFDRFWRGDAARSDTGSHFGLGLPLVRQAVRVMGGDVTAESEVGGRFVVNVRLPRR